ncbi:hypothetical protein K9M59_00680 [Candidatus Gracilibacteria bacterium]|nr:hypothetical protein [Candidatus Gracilibacteria bacterium]MCF7819094.1 hypothetical protein [Candidatus Gracilibacteria bacterium]
MNRNTYFFSIVFFVFFALVANAQTIEYFDEDWQQVSTKKEADYYRVIHYNSAGEPVGIVKDYYITGKLQSEGLLNSSLEKEGHWIWYYESGNKEQEAIFKNGLPNTDITYYDESGKIEDIDPYERFSDIDILLGQGNYEKAIPLLENLANRGNYDAPYMLGMIWQYSKGNLQKAIKYYKIAADENDHLKACLELGLIYYRETNELSMATKYYRKAAEKESTEGQLMLGMIYLEVGMKAARYKSSDEYSPTLKEARKWLLKAKNNGSTHAKEMLDDNQSIFELIQ